MTVDRVHSGVHKELEAAADELLRQAVADLPRSEKMDILTPWKERDRLSREVYTSDGVPDPAVRLGMYNRSWNPGAAHLNSRDGHVRARRTEESSVYVPETSYQDWAGQVIIGWTQRPLSDCRVVRWGNQVRLQCVPCRRYLAVRSPVQCRRCRTTYVEEGNADD